VDQEVAGLEVEIVDLAPFRPVLAGLTAVAAVRASHPEDFAWRQTGDRFWLDLLLGTDRIRLGIEAGRTPSELMAEEAAAVAEFEQERAPHLLYR